MFARFIILFSFSLFAFAADELALPKDASSETKQAQEAVLKALPFSNREDFELAKQGFVGTSPDLIIKNADGRVVWSLNDYKFLSAVNPAMTVNPSLWRQAQLNMNNGLYKVMDRVYQVRGYDIANMDIIEGDTGLIIIDPLISKETAKAALDL